MKKNDVSERSSEREGKRMGQGDFANMPQNVIMKPYPKNMSTDKHLDDSMGRLDSDAESNRKKIKKTMDKGMY